MNEKKLKETAGRHAPAAQKGRHIVTAFVSGGLIGAFGQLLLVVYQQLLHLDHDQALAMMSVSVMLIAALMSGLGRYDGLAQKCGAGMFIPICGFANSLASSALEGKSEGLVYGIGSGMFRLAGTASSLPSSSAPSAICSLEARCEKLAVYECLCAKQRLQRRSAGKRGTMRSRPRLCRA